jgi:DNA helicase-2/ATP-dependent DNA helicase PcrA
MLLDRTDFASYIRDRTEEGEERWNNVMELRSVVQEYAALPAESALVTFLEEVSLVSEVDNLDEQTNAVTLLTLHTAKGLEFDTVFIAGMEEGVFPHSRSFGDNDQMEEERRLCYVGLTRAKSKLYLVHTFRRTMYGNQMLSEPSRFVCDIPDHLVQGRTPAPAREPGDFRSPVRVGEDDRSRPRASGGIRTMAQRRNRNSRGKTARQPQEVGSTFSVGDRVNHPTFGEGIVISSQVSTDDEEVTVAFVGGVGIKRLMASLAGLVKAD